MTGRRWSLPIGVVLYSTRFSRRMKATKTPHHTVENDGTIHPQSRSPMHVADPAVPGAASRSLPATAPRAVRVMVMTCEYFARDEMTTYAAALAYRGLVALFPFFIFLIAIVNALDIWQLFGMLGDWARTNPDGRVPRAIKEWMVGQARERSQGAVLSVGAIAAVWAVASGARVLRTALNVAGDMPEIHPAWKRALLSLVVAPVICVALLIVVGLFTVTRNALLSVSAWFDVHDVVVALWDWLRLPLGLLVAGLAIASLYRFAPSHRQTWRTLLPGITTAAVVWGVASLIFSRAVASVLQFGVTYGTFSAAIVLLVYIYLAAAGLLFGAELNAVLARQREGDSTAKSR